LRRACGASFGVARLPTYPDHIQEALLDLAYNLGPAGLTARERLIAAARKGDWEAVAALSNRRQVGDERNKEIAGLILGQKVDA
jgi:GH24 family phage-related lysozyme (muramidase)